jgi:hypothetical protein
VDAVFEQDVGRLDVAVNQAVLVGRRQAAGDLRADPQHLRHVERPDPVEPLLQGLAGDVFRHQMRERLLLDRVNGDDVLMADRGGGAGFAQEALARRRGGGQVRGHDLDRHRPVQFPVERFQHGATTALAKHFQHLVVTQPAQGFRFRGRLQEAEDVRPDPGLLGGGGILPRGWGQLLDGGALQEVARLVVAAEQGLDPLPQGSVVAAGLVEVRGPLGGGALAERNFKDGFFGHGSVPNRWARNRASTVSTSVSRPRYSLSYLPGTVSVTSAKAVRGSGTPAARNTEWARTSRPFAGSIGIA